ncbi:MAG: geranylgeranyl reductase family protein [Cyanobacteria bacterium P01_A01_bin.105]
MFDCIIVGAGPAGATAAYHLAARDRKVLLLEKAKLPRYKPCTGAVSPSVSQWLPVDFTPAVNLTTRRVRYTWKLADAVEAVLETEPIWMVQRPVFDKFLVDQAVAQGAELLDGTPITGLTKTNDGWQVELPQGSQTARYLIAADGATGPMAQWLGFKPFKSRQATVLEVPAPLDPAQAAINFEFGLAKQGCLWSFPKQKSYAMGITSFVGGDVKQPRSLLSDYAETFGTDVSQGEFYTHPLQLWQGQSPLHTHRAVRVGEAAGLVDPLAVEGIRPAMYSGVRAADAIDRALTGEPQALAQYTQTIQTEWCTDMQWAQRIASVFFRVPSIGYQVGIKRPSATQRLGQILAGEVRYADIANRVIRRMSTALIPGRR